MREYRVASLFSGCGGTDLGFEGGFRFLRKVYKKNPIKVVFANDINETASDVFDSNFGLNIFRGDIKTLRATDIPSHDILTGGFPCQSFSIVAQNPPRLGITDPRGELFFEMCRLLRAKSPECFVAENVKGIVSANKKQAFPLILDAFRDCGYHVDYRILNASQYGIPQKRERVFIIGFKKENNLVDMLGNLESRKILSEVPLSEILEEEESIPEKYFFSEKAVKGLKKSNKAMNKGRAQNIDFPCNTVTAHLAKVSLNSTDPVLKLNGRYRRFTPREVARIQSFPERFQLASSDLKTYRVLGNAIPPVLAWHVANSVIASLNTN